MAFWSRKKKVVKKKKKPAKKVVVEEEEKLEETEEDREAKNYKRSNLQLSNEFVERVKQRDPLALAKRWQKKALRKILRDRRAAGGDPFSFVEDTWQDVGPDHEHWSAARLKEYWHKASLKQKADFEAWDPARDRVRRGLRGVKKRPRGPGLEGVPKEDLRMLTTRKPGITLKSFSISGMFKEEERVVPAKKQLLGPMQPIDPKLHRKDVFVPYYRPFPPLETPQMLERNPEEDEGGEPGKPVIVKPSGRVKFLAEHFHSQKLSVLMNLEEEMHSLTWESFVFEDGSSYEGTIFNDMATGRGVYQSPTGLTKYEGEWSLNKMEGHGVLKVEIPVRAPPPHSEDYEEWRQNEHWFDAETVPPDMDAPARELMGIPLDMDLSDPELEQMSDYLEDLGTRYATVEAERLGRLAKKQAVERKQLRKERRRARKAAEALAKEEASKWWWQRKKPGRRAQLDEEDDEAEDDFKFDKAAIAAADRKLKREAEVDPDTIPLTQAVPVYEDPRWKKRYGSMPMTGAYKYAGQLKRNKMHGCGVYEINQHLYWGKFYFGDFLPNEDECDYETSALHAGLAEVTAAKARMFQNKPDGMVREMMGPWDESHHPYMYDAEDVWQAPGFVHEYHEVPDLWKDYVVEVDKERQMWVNSFYQAPLRVPMPPELHEAWDEDDEFVVCRFKPQNTDLLSRKRRALLQARGVLDGEVLLHQPTKQIIFWAPNKQGSMQFFSVALKRFGKNLRDEDIKPLILNHNRETPDWEEFDNMDYGEREYISAAQVKESFERKLEADEADVQRKLAVGIFSRKGKWEEERMRRQAEYDAEEAALRAEQFNAKLENFVKEQDRIAAAIAKGEALEDEADEEEDIEKELEEEEEEEEEEAVVDDADEEEEEAAPAPPPPPPPPSARAPAPAPAARAAKPAGPKSSSDDDGKGKGGRGADEDDDEDDDDEDDDEDDKKPRSFGKVAMIFDSVFNFGTKEDGASATPKGGAEGGGGAGAGGAAATPPFPTVFGSISLTSQVALQHLASGALSALQQLVSPGHAERAAVRVQPFASPAVGISRPLHAADVATAGADRVVLISRAARSRAAARAGFGVAAEGKEAAHVRLRVSMPAASALMAAVASNEQAWARRSGPTAYATA